MPSAVLPGLVAGLFPAFYARPGRRELVVVCSKLLLALCWLPFRLSWHAPGTPPDVRQHFGGSLLPVQPMALIQSGALRCDALWRRAAALHAAGSGAGAGRCGAACGRERGWGGARQAGGGLARGGRPSPQGLLPRSAAAAALAQPGLPTRTPTRPPPAPASPTHAREQPCIAGVVMAMVMSFRHSLRLRAQLLCQLAFLTALLQAETAAHRAAADPRQHFVSLRFATALQVLCGALLPLAQHWHFDRQRRQGWRREEEERRRERAPRRRPQTLWQQPEADPPVGAHED